MARCRSQLAIIAGAEYLGTSKFRTRHVERVEVLESQIPASLSRWMRG
jgi:hypothetical protein